MFLYKLEITTEENQLLVAVMIAETDEKAFAYAESHVRRQYLNPPTIAQISLVEKKYLEKGKGYVIEAAAI